MAQEVSGGNGAPESQGPNADFSRIRRVKLDRFTIDRLMMVLLKLDQRVEVEVRLAEKAA